MPVSNLAHFDDLDPPPTTIDPWLVRMMMSIKSDTSSAATSLTYLTDRVGKLEVKDGKRASELDELKVEMKTLQDSNKTLIGRLVRTELHVQQQDERITDLTARSMRDNLIFKTVGDEYKESRNEHTSSIIRRFLAEEMRIPDVEKIVIARCHRMGKRNEDFNRPMIAKFPLDCDLRRILDNAKALKGTDHIVTTQIPSEMNERRQFAWDDYNTARNAKKPVSFSGAQLFIDNTPVNKFGPTPLPLIGSSTSGNSRSSSKYRADGDEVVRDGHIFKAHSAAAIGLMDMREAKDILLRNSYFANCDKLCYGYRYLDNEGNLFENFESSGDSGVGLQILRSLRKQKAVNIVTFLAHGNTGVYITQKSRNASIETAVCGSLLAFRQCVAAGEGSGGRMGSDEED